MIVLDLRSKAKCLAYNYRNTRSFLRVPILKVKSNLKLQPESTTMTVLSLTLAPHLIAVVSVSVQTTDELTRFASYNR